MHRDRGDARLLDRAGIEAARAAWRNDRHRSAECDNRVTRHLRGDRFAELGEDALSKLVSSEVGRRVHRLIGELAGQDCPDVTSAVNRLLVAEPVPGAVRAAVRLQVSQMVVVYLSRLRPLDAELIGVEVPLTSCQADLIWRHTSGAVAIDEVKSSAPAKPSKQVRNLVASGRARFGDAIVGVRRCPTLVPSKAELLNGDRAITAVPPPPWLAVR